VTKSRHTKERIATVTTLRLPTKAALEAQGIYSTSEYDEASCASARRRAPPERARCFIFDRTPVPATTFDIYLPLPLEVRPLARPVIEPIRVPPCGRWQSRGHRAGVKGPTLRDHRLVREG
jgi:hypothetical protein